MSYHLHNRIQLRFRRRQLRKDSTKAERMLWWRLRNERCGYKFRRQQSIGSYIVDFYCAEIKLVVEIDGNIHSEDCVKINDIQRQKFLEQNGFRVIRYRNEQMMDEIEAVAQDIKNWCDKLTIGGLSTTPNPSFLRRGEQPFPIINHPQPLLSKEGRVVALACLLLLFSLPRPAGANVCVYEKDGRQECAQFGEGAEAATEEICKLLCKSGGIGCTVMDNCLGQLKKDTRGEVIELENPIGGRQTPLGIPALIGSVVNYAVSIVGALTLAVFVYGGFLWLTSGGSEEKVSHGMKAMLYAAIGLFIIFGSYAMLKLVFGGLA